MSTTPLIRPEIAAQITPQIVERAYAAVRSNRLHPVRIKGGRWELRDARGTILRGLADYNEFNELQSLLVNKFLDLRDTYRRTLIADDDPANIDLTSRYPLRRAIAE